LFHLARGCGTKGLLGIAPRRGDLIRPLLFCRKKDLLSYLSFLGQPFCFDSTNDDTELTRNYIRQTLIPGLLEINPSAPQACLAMSGILREDDRLLSSLVPEDFPEISILCTLPDPILARLLEREVQNAGGRGLEQVHLKALLRLVRQGKTGKQISLPCGITALREKTRITFCRTAREKKTPENGKEMPIFHEIDIGSSKGDHIVWLELGDTGEIPQKIHNLSTKVKLRSDILHSGLFWRTRRPGDTIRMAGMTRKIRKLQWQSGKSPKERDEMPIFCDKNGPLWLPEIGLRDGAEPKDGQEWVWLCCKK
jgi:tRNA(Ile)-lysidine synthase